MEQRLFDCGQYTVEVTAGNSLVVKVQENFVFTVFWMGIADYEVGRHESLLEKALCHYIEFKDAYRISEWVAAVYIEQS